ncbi:hypothetical protein [Paenilisteria rocourtiae]|uniref:Uncharacterized protein n=1 Tax=Listeria rocourtiae TaxID=647910 RepID=A0A4V6PYL2_9LIST|nr:hypothetical protein [Listeria rocourtiae]EUJ42634.1 hypothetical protein PROCOU_16829 [Listeria rocourtiae FSL F6-920]TDR51786.1 hypothetical protein DFP96_11194 [Listeria rocourtiae]
MIDNQLVTDIVNRRKSLHPDDPSVQKEWERLTNIFTKNEDDTVDYFQNCNPEILAWLSEVFEDISAVLQSQRFITCIEGLALKYPGLDLDLDVSYAKKSMNGN